MLIFRRIHCINAVYGTVILYESDSTIYCMYTVYPPEDEHLRLETCRETLHFMNNNN